LFSAGLDRKRRHFDHIFVGRGDLFDRHVGGLAASAGAAASEAAGRGVVRRLGDLRPREGGGKSGERQGQRQLSDNAVILVR